MVDVRRNIFSVWIAVVVALAATSASAQDIPPDGGTDADIEPFDELCPTDAVGCHTAEVDWLYRDALFDDIMLDTGWVPRGGPIQVRFGVAIGGSTEVALGGTLVTSWPPGLLLALPGRPETGRLSINYGFELIAQIRFDVEVGGIRYDWEGDIPIPFFPEDLRMAGDVIFDPFLLPGAMERPVSVSDRTDRVRVLRFDALDTIIPIPGVGGGFLVALQGELEATYQTERIVFDDAEPIEEEGGTTALDPPIPEDPDDVAGFGPSVTVLLHPEGTLTYDGTVWIVPELYLEVVGTRFDLPLMEIPLRLVNSDEGLAFDDERVDVPLPEVDVQPARLNLGEVMVEEVAAQPLVFVNNGEAALWVAVETTDSPFSVEPPEVVVDPHRTARVSVRFSPDRAGAIEEMFAFATNDPDEPSLVVLLEGLGLARPVEPDAGPGDADLWDADVEAEPDGDVDVELEDDEVVARGCSCRTAGGARSGLIRRLISLLNFF